ncbi:MAG: hypothetical protein KAS84_05155 [Anaerolineales bacterium]|nr:hypothetical protein [Anaerolineales bacterium]
MKRFQRLIFRYFPLIDYRRLKIILIIMILLLFAVSTCAPAIDGGPGGF